MRKFNCRKCKQSLDIDMARKGIPISSTGNGECKPCHNEHAKLYMMRKSAERNPHNYMDCDDCDRTFSKRSANKVLRDKCPFCDSNNIGEYV